MILQRAMRGMLEDQEDAFYYLTVGNANTPQPSIPADVQRGIVQGLYRLPGALNTQVSLLGSGATMSEVQRDGIAAERAQRLGETPQPCVVQRCLGNASGPVIAASDDIRAWPELIRRFVSKRYVTLGTEGFCRSDTRAQLRRFFELDAKSIALAALHAWADERAITEAALSEARQTLGLNTQRQCPWTM